MATITSVYCTPMFTFVYGYTTVLLYTPGIKKYKGSGSVDFIFGPNSISKSK